MEIFSVEEFQERWDELITRVEDGESLGVINEDGQAAVMVRIEDPLYHMYTDHSEGS